MPYLPSSSLVPLSVACVNGICDKDESQSNSLVSINKRTVEKKGQVSSIASISGALTQTSIGKNPACVGDTFVDGLSPIKCEKNVKAVGKPGEVFVKNVTASAFGLVYDGRGGTLLMDGAESMDEVYRSREIRLFSTLCDNFCLWNREMLIRQDF
ncbi:hypothetical protein [Microcystis panniformis]|uniref:hypothetical protein n=1 Tax=Microcystis panniformis TaxID=513223 RepID=UPI000B06411F|nr:hypothetical protein [Microcystis panniformis]